MSEDKEVAAGRVGLAFWFHYSEGMQDEGGLLCQWPPESYILLIFFHYFSKAKQRTHSFITYIY